MQGATVSLARFNGPLEGGDMVGLVSLLAAVVLLVMIIRGIALTWLSFRDEGQTPYAVRSDDAA